MTKSQSQDAKPSATKDGGAGEKGVSHETVGSGRGKDPNNFANDPARAAAAGAKGGHNSHKND